MTRLVGAEYLKFRTTRGWIAVLLVLIGLAGLGAVATVGSAPDSDLGTSRLSQDVIESALFATLIAFVVGVLCVTGEWRHGTATRTFLGTPRRTRVLVAKEIWIVFLALGIAVLALAVVVGVAGIWHAVESSSLLLDSQATRFAGRVLVVTVLWGALGVGLGAVVHNQTLALVGGVVWVLLAEALITLLLGTVDFEDLGDYLPGRALSAVDGSIEDGLSSAAGAAVGLGWVVAIGVLGGVRTARRDVT